MPKGRSSKGTKKPRSKKAPKQLVVTLSTSSGEIEKIEELGLAGKRRACSEAEFAALAGDSSLQDVCDALEAAYMAGVRDGFEDAQCEDLVAGVPQEQDGDQQSFGEGVLRAGIRRIVFRRAVRRGLEGSGKQA